MYNGANGKSRTDLNGNTHSLSFPVHAPGNGVLPTLRKTADPNHVTQTSSWVPPAEAWLRDISGGLPYGWEQAVDADGRPYYINHINKTTTYEDPRPGYRDEPAKPRTVHLTRDAEMGFGFVAGSEKPVIVRFVTEGGPSEGKLEPGDQILKINDEDVFSAPRDHVIQLVRACASTVCLVVCQPLYDSTARKSALLSSAKKAKLKTNPSRVRFAEGIVINGSPLFPTSTFISDSNVPLMPNVLKVFLENGQTKSFKYDANTTVQDVITSLQSKLCLRAIEHFSLVLEQVKSLRRNKLTLLNPDHTLARIASRPGSHNLRCLFRVAFVPRDPCELAQQDLAAFEYLYMQCCNDVVQERYAPELKYDIALRLAALHIHQHAVSNNIPASKVTVKAIEREFGLEKFVPMSLMESMKRKELRKLLTHLLKLNQTMTGSANKSLTSLQAKLYYLTIITELPSYGAKCFSTNIRDCNAETVILVSPKLGISQINGLRNSMPVPLADVEQLNLVRVRRDDQISSTLTLYLPTALQKEVTFSMEDRDAEELVLVLQGYYRLLTDKELPIEQEKETWSHDIAPLYHSQHAVRPARWSYATGSDSEDERLTSFAINPPYAPNKQSGNNVSKVGTIIRKDSKTNTDKLDRNMNNMSQKIEDRNGLCDKDFKVNPVNKTGIDLQSVVSMEILESENAFETKNEEVLKRVAEMQALVENSEQYLTKHQRESSDSDTSHVSSGQDSDTAPAPGQLKHSDSLLLLTQGHKQATEDLAAAVQALDLTETESDTDSICTPSESPYKNRESTSSFGLHSPDNLIPRVGQDTLQELWKRLKAENSDLTCDSIYLDPDIIDLTFIPPPILSAEESVISEASFPPRSFADHANFPDYQDKIVDTLMSKDAETRAQLLNLDLDSFLATMIVPPPEKKTAPTSALTAEQLSQYIIPPPPPVNNAENSNERVQPHNYPDFTYQNGSIVSSSIENRQPEKYYVSNSGSPVRQRKTVVLVKPQENGYGGTLPRCSTFAPPPEIRVNPLSATLDRKTNSSSLSCCSRPRQGSPEMPPQLPPRTETLSRKPPLPPVTSQEVLVRNGYSSLSKNAATAVTDLLETLSQVAAQCNAAQAAGGGTNIDEMRFQEAKDYLTVESRQLVTSSKVLVRSCTLPKSPEFPANLAQCIAHLKKITDLCVRMSVHTAAPLQTRNLVLKVHDVLSVFRDLLTITDIHNDEVLTKRAESLAGVLATLLRSLRVFSP
nr:PREDICTED: FERM and PDZ domain-containing protein 4 isoform X2 [Bemisia tabaci]